MMVAAVRDLNHMPIAQAAIIPTSMSSVQSVPIPISRVPVAPKIVTISVIVNEIRQA